MNTKPSTVIRQNYDLIANLCRQSHEPLFLTHDGENDLVIMDIETYSRREKMLQLREELLKSEEEIENGAQCYPANDASLILGSVIDQIADRHNKTR